MMDRNKMNELPCVVILDNDVAPCALPCVAILDDDVALCAFMGDVAQLAGYRVVSANEGQALPALLAQQPELLLLDLGMANMDGIEVIRQLAQMKFAGRLVIVSGLGASILRAAGSLAELQNLRVAGVLTKPVRADTLRDLLQAPQMPPALRRSAPVVTLLDLARGMANNELILHYQPQVRLDDGAWVGVEALVRWQHPQHGLLYPDAFIDLAERGGLALALTHQVIAIALADCDRALGMLDFSGMLSLNLPPVAMTDVHFPEAVLDAIAGSRCRKVKITFEITETSVPPDPIKALDILTRLALKGFNLSIDDFGTGHSSLENLQQLPFGELKIDLGFVRVAETSPSARAIVEHSIALGRQLGLVVLAEGVENAVLWQWLQKAGCELAQGYFIARPMALEYLAAWQKEWEQRRPGLAA
jgi:EAL domain-containing protein (putative c-di-GMP-specific phosphodiesterase class I)/ActR/RegA family two-component response regulator